jgi:hypothetical protein
MKEREGKRGNEREGRKEREGKCTSLKTALIFWHVSPLS